MQTTTATTATVEAASNMGRFYPDRECLTRGIRRGVVAPMARRVTARNGHLRIKGLGGFGEIERGGPAAMGRPSASELTPRGWSYKVSATFRISDRVRPVSLYLLARPRRLGSHTVSPAVNPLRASIARV